MQERNLDALLTLSKPLFDDIAKVNKDFVDGLNDDNSHAPSAEKLQQIRLWYELYLKKNPKATTRNAKRATIRHFNLTIKK